MTDTLPTVDILIVTWNRCEDLLRALDSIAVQSMQPRQVIVVDNGSEDGTRETIPQRRPDAVFLPQTENLGACGGRNAGMPYVHADLVFFMDDDSELTPGCLEEVCRRFASNPKLGGVQPEILLPTDKATDEAPVSRPNPHPISAAWCVRTAALPPNPWPEHFVRQGEEMWAAMHLYERGYKSEIWPAARCIHHQAPGGQREKVFYFFTRNSFLLYLQRFPLPLALPMSAYKILRTLMNVRSGKELRAWASGLASAFGMILTGRAARCSIGWSGARAYLRDVRRNRGGTGSGGR